MAKFLLAALALVGLLAAARYGLQSRAPAPLPESAAHRQLENVRGAAARFEADSQKRGEELMRGSTENASDAPADR